MVPTKLQATRIKVNIKPERDIETETERKRDREPTLCASGCTNSEHELSQKLEDEQFLMKVFC